jgi:hypothetical protein
MKEHPKGGVRVMNVPITLSEPQVILLIIGIVGLLLLISALAGIRSTRVEVYENEKGKSTYVRRGGGRWGRGILGILLLAIAISLLWIVFVLQTYLGLTGEIKVAHIRATPLANAAHEMSVELILYDENGHTISDHSYLLQGDEWMVQGDILKLSPWLNVMGLHSGYKLTRLEGRFDDPNLEANAKHIVIELNGGDDNFFKTMYAQRTWFSPFVDASYGNAVFQGAGTFDIFATQDALIARPAR